MSKLLISIIFSKNTLVINQFLRRSSIDFGDLNQTIEALQNHKSF